MHLVSEWANGGNLRDLWKGLQSSVLTPDLLKATVNQLLGLVGAISQIYQLMNITELGSGHANLKPENILWFRDHNDKAGIGMLKVGDWNFEAKRDSASHSETDEAQIYEAPEDSAIRNQYLKVPGQPGTEGYEHSDVWALGCIILEFLICLAYGYDQLGRFHTRLRLSSAQKPRFYQIRKGAYGRMVTQVHNDVVGWMDHMAKDPFFDPEATALGSLLNLVRDRLLVIQLPEVTINLADGSQDPSPPSMHEMSLGTNIVVTPAEQQRTTPAPQQVLLDFQLGLPRLQVYEFRDQVRLILGHSERESYWMSGQPGPPPVAR